MNRNNERDPLLAGQIPYNDQLFINGIHQPLVNSEDEAAFTLGPRNQNPSQEKRKKARQHALKRLNELEQWVNNAHNQLDDAYDSIKEFVEYWGGAPEKEACLPSEETYRIFQELQHANHHSNPENNAELTYWLIPYKCWNLEQFSQQRKIIKNGSFETLTKKLHDLLLRSQLEPMNDDLQRCISILSEINFDKTDENITRFREILINLLGRAVFSTSTPHSSHLLEQLLYDQRSKKLEPIGKNLNANEIWHALQNKFMGRSIDNLLATGTLFENDTYTGNILSLLSGYINNYRRRWLKFLPRPQPPE